MCKCVAAPAHSGGGSQDGDGDKTPQLRCIPQPCTAPHNNAIAQRSGGRKGAKLVHAGDIFGKAFGSIDSRRKKDAAHDAAFGVCMQPGRTCTGTFIKDVRITVAQRGADLPGKARQVHECVLQCRKHPQCHCVTWMQKKSAQCRFMTGSTTEDRRQPELFSARALAAPCDGELTPCRHTTCKRTWELAKHESAGSWTSAKKVVFHVIVHHDGAEPAGVQHKCAYDTAQKKCLCDCNYHEQ